MSEQTDVTDRSSGSEPRRRVLLMGAVVLSFLMVTAAAWRFGRTTADPDLWGHLLTGLETIDAGGYLTVDQWSYLTGDVPWINHPWIGQVSMAFVYDQFDSAGLVVVKALLALGIVAFLFWWLLRRGVAPVRATLIGLLVILVLTPTLGTFRPQIFTTVAAMVLLVVMVGVEEGKTRLLWILPPLFLLWANMHGGFLAGLAILGTWAVIHVWREPRPFRFAPLAAWGGALLASLVNPNGWRLLAFLVETATVPRPEIQDWQSIDLTSAVGIAYLILSAFVIVSLVLDRHSVNLALAVPLVALVIAPISAWRHLQLFGPAVVIVGADHIKRLSDRLDSDEVAESLDQRQTGAIAAVLAITVVLTSVGLGGFASCISIDASQFVFPQRAVTAWATAQPEGNAVVPFESGEYVRWHLGPDLRVSIDGRRETVYADEVTQANLDFTAGRDNWEELLELAPPDWILTPTVSPVLPLVLDTGEWNVAYEDSVATVLTRADVEIASESDAPVDGHGSCFPAGPRDRGTGEL